MEGVSGRGPIERVPCTRCPGGAPLEGVPWKGSHGGVNLGYPLDGIAKKGSLGGSTLEVPLEGVPWIGSHWRGSPGRDNLEGVPWRGSHFGCALEGSLGEPLDVVPWGASGGVPLVGSPQGVLLDGSYRRVL